MKTRLGSLLFVAVVLLGAGIAFSADGSIRAGKPRYVAKKHEAWKERGRIVALAEEAPAFTLAVFDAKRKKVAEAATEELEGGRRVCEVWLEPGVYTVLVTAPGYTATDVHKLEVRAGADLRIGFSFTP